MEAPGPEHLGPTLSRKAHCGLDIEALQMLKFSINQSNKLNFTVGFRQQTELWELEELDLLNSSIPEDLIAF